jgi:hypothetical protein
MRIRISYMYVDGALSLKAERLTNIVHAARTLVGCVQMLYGKIRDALGM